MSLSTWAEQGEGFPTVNPRNEADNQHTTVASQVRTKSASSRTEISGDDVSRTKNIAGVSTQAREFRIEISDDNLVFGNLTTLCFQKIMGKFFVQKYRRDLKPSLRELEE